MERKSNNMTELILDEAEYEEENDDLRELSENDEESDDNNDSEDDNEEDQDEDLTTDEKISEGTKDEESE